MIKNKYKTFIDLTCLLSFVRELNILLVMLSISFTIFVEITINFSLVFFLSSFCCVLLQLSNNYSITSNNWELSFQQDLKTSLILGSLFYQDSVLLIRTQWFSPADIVQLSFFFFFLLLPLCHNGANLRNLHKRNFMNISNTTKFLLWRLRRLLDSRF